MILTSFEPALSWQIEATNMGEFLLHLKICVLALATAYLHLTSL